MAHYELAVALWEAETGEYIPGTSWCNLLCPHPALANIGASRHSAVLWWLRGDLGRAFE